MTHNANAILASIDPQILSALLPYLTNTNLKQGHIIVDSRERVKSAVFPYGGVLSCVVETLNGTGIETGMIGRDGAFGALQALDHRTSINKVVVQVPCPASMIDGVHLKSLANKHPELRDWLMRYEQFNMAQVQQTAACNALHSVEQRACRWFLRIHDLVGDEFPLTQEFLAQMMGVRRTSVTTTASKLQADGLITYSRGKMRILDLGALRHVACECAGVLRESYDELMGTDVKRINRHSSGSDAIF